MARHWGKDWAIRTRPCLNASGMVEKRRRTAKLTLRAVSPEGRSNVIQEKRANGRSSELYLAFIAVNSTRNPIWMDFLVSQRNKTTLGGWLSRFMPFRC